MPTKHPAPAIGTRFGCWTVVGGEFRNEALPPSQRRRVPLRCDCGQQADACISRLLYAGRGGCTTCGRGRTGVVVGNPLPAIGDRIGSWTVTGESFMERGNRRVPVACDCGNEGVKQLDALRIGQGSCKACAQRRKKKAAVVIGERLGSWTVLAEAGRRDDGKTRVVARCECGHEAIRPLAVLRRERRLGCEECRPHTERVKTHGESHTRLWVVWQGMRSRCNNPRHTSYPTYGGRGIRVCEEWQDFEAFKRWAQSAGWVDDGRPTGAHTLSIERINPAGNYEPANCEWIPMGVNASRMMAARKAAKAAAS